jgi:hypothetical protein
MSKKSNNPAHQIPKTQQPQQQQPQQQQLTVAKTPVPATSEEALERHLAKWGGSPGQLFAFNGNTGIHRTLDDDVEVPGGTEFVMFLHEAQKGFIKFNGPGEPPTLKMIRIDENVEEITRDSLGDNDETKWPIVDGKPKDPWIEQYVIPSMRNDPGGELFVYVARGIVAMLSVESLLGRWRHSPRRREGLVPVVKVDNGTYWNKRFNADRPKPIMTIVRWVTKTGTPPPPPASSTINQIEKPSLSEELSDSIGF